MNNSNAAQPIYLSDKEREILQDIVDTWDDADAPLSGRFSYQDAFDLLTKLGMRSRTPAAIVEMRR